MKTVLSKFAESVYRIDIETSIEEIKRDLTDKCIFYEYPQHQYPKISGVAIDSRSIVKNNLFFALEGENFDGHDFIWEAKNKSAIGAVVDLKKVDDRLNSLVDQNFFLVCVEDTSSFLLDFAFWHREKFNPLVVIIVGSNGKTTSKEMIANILGSVFNSSELVITTENQNNHIGVPLNLMRINKKTKYVVLEVGMNTEGEIARLTKRINPSLVLITNAQRDHQEFLSSVSVTARENGMAIKALKTGGITVFPSGSDYEEIWSAQASGRASKIVRFGLCENFESRITGTDEYIMGEITQNFPLSLKVKGNINLDSFNIKLNGIGKQFALNALSAVTVTNCLKIPSKKIVNSLEKFLPIKGRGFIYSLQNQVFLIDDTYNANPDSMVAAINALNELEAIKCMVLADMGELGEKSKGAHVEILSQAVDKIEKIFLVGKEFAKAAQLLGVGTYCCKKDLLVKKVKKWVNVQRVLKPKKDIAVWLKGSRSNRLETVVTGLVEKELN